MTSLNEQLEIFTHRASESEVLVELGDVPGIEVRSFQLCGPRCERAHTLPATFQANQSGTLLVTDPCYWTPQLPFLYDVELSLQLADGTTTTWKHTVGLRRWEIDGRNLFRERRRIVLRAVAVAEFDVADLAAAVEAEMALVVLDPSEAFLQRASELGVPIVADLRGLSPSLTSYTWQPSVVLVLLDKATPKPHAIKTASVARPACGFAANTWPDAITIELSNSERPPAWAATCEKPLIAIRRQGAYAELAEARRACDQLQADLAPQFNLAGYFV
jgi:hypothetical protein